MFGRTTEEEFEEEKLMLWIREENTSMQQIPHWLCMPPALLSTDEDVPYSRTIVFMS